MRNQKLSSHLQKDAYGDFRLTDAIRPSMDLKVVPTEGYRVETYHDPKNRVRVPMLAAAVSRERLFDAFIELLQPLGAEVDVILETSHHSKTGAHRDLVRETMDLPVLISNLYDYEDLLLNDGCTGIAVIDGGQGMEVQFDEHKLLVVYAAQLRPFREALEHWGVMRNDRMKLITEAEHMHSTSPELEEAFEQLCNRLGVGETLEHVNW